ncbi:plant basic secretory protein [Obba rivulosa]|uniref:Plant basic secretory protein n=1 Tax=Obba rivulosa TaxID=1052685 RepID=A0A8E2J6F1_9APHY|nr:plant basic secretory protein [Obba rivulosa]
MPPPLILPPANAPEPAWPIPKFELCIEDLAHPGARLFLDSGRPESMLRDAVRAVCSWLYTPDSVPHNVQVVRLVLRDMPGVAHTSGSQTHKEIVFAVSHILNSAARAADEVRGVLVHEMVHCFQYNALGTCPGGLIEGIADWVRLRAGLAPPHWREGTGGRWDAGYETTGYFLDWLETRYEGSFVRALNARLKDTPYDENLWVEITGQQVGELWATYKDELEQKRAAGTLHS